MIDLDALKAELEAAGVPCQKMWRSQPDPEGWSLFIGEPGGNSYVQDDGWFALYGNDFDSSAFGIIALHVAPKPAEQAPDRAALVGRLAVFLRRELTSLCRNHDYCEPDAERLLAAVEAAGASPAQRRFPDPHKRIVFGDS